MPLLPYHTVNRQQTNNTKDDDDDVTMDTSRGATALTEQNDDDNDEIYFGQEHVYAPANHNLSIARGTFGQVSLAFYHDTNDTLLLQVCACKTLYQAWQTTNNNNSAIGTTKRSLSPSARAELTALQRLAPHPNIVSLLAVVTQQQQEEEVNKIMPSLTLVLEYAPVDLGLILEWKRRQQEQTTTTTAASYYLSWPTIGLLAQDVLRALQHCHDTHGMLHGDVKPSNFVLSLRTGRLQLCDFGLAYFFQKRQASPNHHVHNAMEEPREHFTTMPALGTLHYRPPEVLLGAPALHAAVDLYAAGLVLAEMIHLRPLLPGTNDLSQLQYIFGALGTPLSNDDDDDDNEESSWHTALPDWGKLQFTPQPATPWPTLLPRLFEEEEKLLLTKKEVDEASWARTRLASWIPSLVRLNPAKRATAATCLTGNVNHIIKAATTLSCDNYRAALLQECLPMALLPPIFLSHDKDEGKIDSPAQRLAAMAKTRRTFLFSAGIVEWQDK